MHYKKTREFGQMRYRLHGYYPTKREAEHVAMREPQIGDMARVVEHEKGYCVYVRGKE